MSLLSSLSDLWLTTGTYKNSNSSSSSSSSSNTGYFSNGYQPNNINGAQLSKSGMTIGSTGLKGSKNMAGSSMNDQNIWTTPGGDLYIWVGMDGNSVPNGLDGSKMYGYYQLVGTGGKLWNNVSGVDFSSSQYKGSYANQPWYENQTNLWATTSNSSSNKSTASSGSSGGGAVGAVPDYSGLLSAKDKQIDKLIKELEEAKKPKVYTAKELAEQYDIMDLYNTDYWNNIYDKATNEYFNNAVNEQQRLRTDYDYDNNLYVNNLMDEYLKSYNNAAPTAASRGAMAANALSAKSNLGITNSKSDMGMLDSINQLEQDRIAELANNKQAALETYQGIGAYLMQLGADHNKSDVTDYTNTLYNISTRYAADRALSQSIAKANATKYAGLARAAETNAATAASSYANDNYKRLYNIYSSVYGNKANTAYTNTYGY